MVAETTKPCIVSCSVLKDEIKKLVKEGGLDADLVFVSKYFHVDYALIEKNLRQVLANSVHRFSGPVILVYGDLCLGPNNEMKNLAEEYGVVKVDALNCVDCLLGGKGKFLQADPDHDLLFLSPGMIGFFSNVKEKARQEGIDEDALKQLFNGLKGIVLLDTLGQRENSREELEKLQSGLAILETREIDLSVLKKLILEAMEKTKRKRSGS
jgi:hypothetical protein